MTTDQSNTLRLVPTPPMQKAHLLIIGCPKVGCAYATAPQSEGQAVRDVCAHIVAVHGGGEEQ